MRIGIINYWKIDRFVFMPMLALAIAPHKVEVMVIGVGLRFWR